MMTKRKISVIIVMLFIFDAPQAIAGPPRQHQADLDDESRVVNRLVADVPQKLDKKPDRADSGKAAAPDKDPVIGDGAERPAALDSAQAGKKSPPPVPPPADKPQSSAPISETQASKKSGPRRLADHPDCAATVRQLCSRSVLDNNFAVLDCLQRDQAVAERIPAACQHAVWRLKFNLTHNVKFDQAANGACLADLEELTDCRDQVTGSGHRVSCLIEHKHNIRSPECLAFLSRLEPIVFSDFRMIRPFAKACMNDIKTLKCGRLSSEPRTEQEDVENQLPQSQGLTIACLSQRAAALELDCRKQLLRVAELQSDDYHNDRQLFYACREDRERLCASVTAGDGRVFSCLGRQSPTALSEKCKQELKRVHSLMQYDYKVEHRFAQACQKDLAKQKCDLGDAEDAKEHGMVRALLCLENALMNDGAEAVSTECKRQMLKVRTEYLSEPDIDPELQKQCAEQIGSCRKDGLQDQQLLHCIMRLVQDATDAETVSGCKQAIFKLLRVAMPTKDMQVDPVLTDSCRAELDSRCVRSQHKNGYVCLKTLIANEPESVGTDCADRMAELEYFENRDFKLNDRMYKACKEPAHSLCNATKDWFQTDREQGYQPAAVVYNCLFHRIHAKGRNRVPKPCTQELVRSLEERANRVKLDPRLYRPCITDLASKCADKPGSGQEFRCLQDKLNELTESCRAAVKELTIAASQDIRLSPDVIMVRSCAPFVQAHCNKEADAISDDTVMECLIRLKKHPQMPSKCRAGVEHHQMVALKDVEFSHAFAEACRGTIGRLCPGAASKLDAVKCLSDIVLKDTLTDAEQRVPPKCRNKLTFEMLQRAQNIDLNPGLKGICSQDLREFCRDNEEPLTCLKDHSEDLSPGCHDEVFKRQKLQMEVPIYDAKLMKRCEAMITKHCTDKTPTEIFSCLRSRMHDEEFDRRCRRIIYKRMRVQNTNYELNPDLRRACQPDITNYCTKQMKAGTSDRRFKSTEDKLHETVMQCLRNVTAEGKPLRPKCHRYMRDMLFEYNMNYRLDPRLSRACKSVIDRLCHDEVADVAPDASNLLGVTECLKRAAAEDKILKGETTCKQEVQLMFREMQADIHVDPILYRACSFEIRNLCRGIPLGNGRQMSCAVSLFKDPQANQMISKQCRDRLEERVKLMESAFRAVPPESLREVVVQMSASPARVYFLLTGLVLVIGLLLVGICAGRVTKRVRVDMKNR